MTINWVHTKGLIDKPDTQQSWGDNEVRIVLSTCVCISTALYFHMPSLPKGSVEPNCLFQSGDKKKKILTRQLNKRIGCHYLALVI